MATVVVAEDNVDHLRLLLRILAGLGHEVIGAPDGAQALALIRADRPDLVVADVDMPKLDGFRLCRALRDDPALAAIPVVLVTGYLPPDDPRPASAGAVAVVRKPFSVQALTGVLRDVLGPPAAAPPHAPAGPAAAGDAFVDALLRSLDVGVLVVGPDGRATVLNQPVRDLFGTAVEDLPAAQWPAAFGLRHHDGTPMRPGDMPSRRALAGQPVRRADVLAHDRLGRSRWLVVNAEPIRDPAGGVTGAVSAVHDVTAECHARQYDRCRTDVLNALVSARDLTTAATGVLRVIGTSLGWPYLRLWLVDPVIERLRPEAIYTAPDHPPLPMPATFERGEGLAGRCWQTGELIWVPDIHAAESPVLPEVAAACDYRAAGAVPIRSGETVIGVMTYFSPDRQEPEPALAILLTAVAGHIGAALDQRRADELDLRLAASTDEYLALVGHELRTPLTSIAAYTDLIADSPEDTRLADVRELFEVVSRNTDRLRTLVEQLLDLAALESGHVAFAADPVDLGEVAAEAVAAASRPVTVRTTGRTVVIGDRDRLGRLVEDLLSNAIKFSPEGSPVTVSVTGADEAVVLTVDDEGFGIPEGQHARMFRRLYRATNVRDRAVPGTGLGLTLSRIVAERHHGTITLRPREPAGTSAVVRLPAAATTSPEAPARAG